MTNRMHPAVALTIVLAVSICTNVFAAVGRTPGQFAVSANGSAQYSIPLWVPPGIRGIQPKLALVYDSHLPSGIMGPGWTLSGLSSITRCNPTFAQDGAPAPITLTTTDGFCLDGNRLRGVPAGSTSTYQTEIANFSQVTASGTAGTGPSYFTVEGKDGLTYEYGNTADSKILPSTSSTTPYIWALDKVTDRNGNHMTFTYYQASGAYVPLTIQYTAANGSTSFPYVVNFNYTTLVNTHPNVTKRYLAGTETLQTQELSNVTITSSGTIVREYELVYTASAVTGRATLTSIQECANPTGAGGTATDCLAATSVTYQAGVLGVTSPATSSGNGYSDVVYSVDIDGDGRKDLVFGVYNRTAHTYAWYVQFATSTGYGSVTSVGLSSAGILLDDLDGSGLTDIISTSVNPVAYKWNGSGFTQTTIPITISAATTLADIDGDGRPDLAVLTVNGSSSTLAVYLNTSTGGAISFASTPAITQALNLLGYTVMCLYGDNNSCSGRTLAQNSPVTHFDFNGDGRSDLLLVTSYSTFGWTAYELAYNGSTFIEAGGASLGTGTTPNPFVALNFNDDACTDLMGTTELQISQCNGSSFLDVYIPSGGVAGLAVDWDGDGRTDILANVGGSWELYKSQGDAFATGVSTGMSVGSGTWIVTDQNGDGLDDLAFLNSSNGLIDYGLHNGAGQLPDLAILFKDGFNNSVAPTYVSMVGASNYFVWGDQAFPYQNYLGPLYLVNAVTFSDPSSASGGTYFQDYFYAGASLNLQGRGFAGFGAQQQYDSRNGVWETFNRNRAFPYIGMLNFDARSQDSLNSKIINWLTNTLSYETLDGTANNERYFPYASVVNDNVGEVGGAKNGQIITNINSAYGAPDIYGNFGSVTTVVTDEDSQSPASPYNGDTWTSKTVTTFAPEASTWCLNLPTEVQVTNSGTAPNVPSITRTVAYNNPDYTYCRETEKVIEPNSTYYKLVEDYGWDTNQGNFGNLYTLTVSGVGISTRVTTINWLPNGQFPQSILNPMSQSVALTFDPNTGMKLTQTDPNYTKANPLITTWTYDDFARKTQETRPDNTYTVWQYNDCATYGGCLFGSHALAIAHYIYNVGGSILNDGTTYFDTVDRPIMANNMMLSGYDRNEVRYDSLGRVAQQAMPCVYSAVATTCTYWSTYQYDLLNRPVLAQRPISAANSNLQSTNYGYAGRTTTVQDALGNTNTKISLVTGSLARSQDPTGYYQNFAYDAFGSLTSVTDKASNTLFTATYAYGIGAFQINATDIDLDLSTAAGQHRVYTYDALGEVTAWTDANAHSFSQTYDLLSRPWVRTEPDLTTTWNWGNSAASYNIGRLQSVTATGTSTYTDAYVYDSKTRLSTDTKTLPGDASYTYTYTYNSTTGLLSTLQYPAVVSPAYQVTLQYGYSNGILSSITDTQTGTAYWTANAINPRGQVTQETLGNGVVTNRAIDAVTGWVSTIQSGVGGGSGLQNNSFMYDELGDLTQRQDGNLLLTENFFYDTDNRFSYSTLGGATNLQVAYDTTGMGNIVGRSDVAGGAAWTYDPVRKHAVTQAGSSALSYSYDNNGNVLSRFGYTNTWTSYNYPSSVTSSGESATFQYGPDRQRWKTVYTGSIGTETTYHAGKMLEKVVNGGISDYRHYIYAGGELVAIYSRQSSGTNAVHYVLGDHQASFTNLLTSTGTLDVNESFSPFGGRRNGETWSGAPLAADETAINAVSRDGYTGRQTAIGTSMNLNHMNGRIEDAVTGRFLSPDPYMPDAGNTQSFNRYSYVNNNPLTYADPSGFDPVIDPITVVGYLGGPENPWADAAGVAVAAADVFGLSSVFGGGGPSLTPNQQVAVHHGISLTTSLPDTVVETAKYTPEFLQGFASAGGSFLFGADATLAISTEPSTDPSTLDQIDVNGVRYAMHGFDPIPFVPGGAALECIVMHCSAGQKVLAGIGVVPFLSWESGAVRGTANLLGRTFGRLGTIVENPGIELQGFEGSSQAGHAVNQIINRGVTPSALQATLSNPTVVLQQAGGRFLYLTEQTAVVITNAGQVVTAWGQETFGPGILEVLSEVGAASP